ncbi:MAG: hypothetical protein UY05_C0006G0020 [Candidatus Peregrinibacteria bacterium GW2011_GWA2_47_7]|nr:MAG: hypothetical protein UY05_C0006G0020 [Candidatus Peregrinibacteria bacterium GW2011_GWA2_47_7]
MLLNTTSVHQIQRNYRKIFDEVVLEKKPLIVLNNNKPEVVIIEINQFEILQKKADQYELEMAKQAIVVAHKEKKAGKLKKLKSLSDLA